MFPLSHSGKRHILAERKASGPQTRRGEKFLLPQEKAVKCGASDHFCREVGLLPPGGGRRQPFKGPQSRSDFGVSQRPQTVL